MSFIDGRAFCSNDGAKGVFFMKTVALGVISCLLQSRSRDTFHTVCLIEWDPSPFLHPLGHTAVETQQMLLLGAGHLVALCF